MEIFDDIDFKGLFEDAQVEAPEGVFEGIMHRLAVRRRRRIVAYTLSGMAVAAALACVAVFIPAGQSTSETEVVLVASEVISVDQLIENQGVERVAQAQVPVKKTGSIGKIGKDIPLQQKNVNSSAVPAEKTSTQQDVVIETITDEVQVQTVEKGTVQPAEKVETKASEKTTAKSAGKSTPANNNPATAHPADRPASATARPTSRPTSSKTSTSKNKPKVFISSDMEGNNVSSRLTKQKLHSRDIAFQQADNNYVSPDSEANYAMPATFGLGIKLPFAEKWSLGSGLEFSILSTHYAKANRIYNGSLTEYTNVTNRITYIGIPLNVYYSLISDRKSSFYAYGGFTAEKAVNNRFTSPVGLNHSEKVEGVQLSIQAGIGMEIKLKGPLSIFFDPAVKYYFPNESQPISIRTREPLTMGFDAGLRFSL